MAQDTASNIRIQRRAKAARLTPSPAMPWSCFDCGEGLIEMPAEAGERLAGVECLAVAVEAAVVVGGE